MGLNIHTLIHPIIQKLAYEIIYQKPQSTDNEKTLGILIFYETLRKWLKIDNIYVKKVDALKESYFSNQLDKYLIITNIIECYNFLGEVERILPQSCIKHIEFYKADEISKYSQKLKEHKIIIFEKFLKNYEIINIINYLYKHKITNLNHVKIICITCNQNILKYIAQKYPQLNIYTTKII
uniref:hypothetical protein n=1 Tax=Crassiphycus birdiae TaxID=2782747 RepID=UPI001D1244BA|nr:hypothetical protein LK100_pgp005 [Crassiphycus birdiae]YP_010197077.1 hypothetical protein LK099_pgp005 [Crassiphycus corneus]UAD83242.1 hypothetical protein [Crassiphycus birdiae]UAD84881.1 hypothetical protein [Crassiphycus corneus]